MNVIKKRLLEEPAYAGAVLIAIVGLVIEIVDATVGMPPGLTVGLIGLAAAVTGRSVRSVVSPTNGN